MLYFTKESKTKLEKITEKKLKIYRMHERKGVGCYSPSVSSNNLYAVKSFVMQNWIHVNQSTYRSHK
jgi:hypothetical protein